MIKGNGGEGPVGDFGYAMFWKIEELLTMNKDYNVIESLEGFLIIGSDGGGEAFAIYLKSDSAKYVQVPFVGMCEEDCLEMGGDFTTFLEKLSEEQ